jgi:hypothetical protein
MAQLLCRSNEVGYFTNFTALFPRSPIAASSMTGVWPRRSAVPLSSHYGRTSGLAAPNDGLYIWDRWLGPNRIDPDQSLIGRSHKAMRKFFGAFESVMKRPFVTKNNILNAIASEVATALPSARFICMERNPLPLAQSLLVARSYIHGRRKAPYGLSPPGDPLDDSVGDVVRQVRYLTAEGRRQASLVGSERFRIVSYEALCARPRELVSEIAKDWLDTKPALESIPEALKIADRQLIDDQSLERLRTGLAESVELE